MSFTLPSVISKQAQLISTTETAFPSSHTAVSLIRALTASKSGMLNSSRSETTLPLRLERLK